MSNEPTVEVPVSEIEALRDWRERERYAAPGAVYDLIERIPDWDPPVGSVSAVAEEVMVYSPDLTTGELDAVARRILRRLRVNGFDVVVRRGR